MPETALILVTFNRLGLLKESLASALSLPEPVTLYLVNNASTDQTADFLKALQDALNQAIEESKNGNPEKGKEILEEIGIAGVNENYNNKTLKVFSLDKNLGGAGGFWFGLSKAMEKGYDYYWLMDDDTILYPDSLSTLLEAAKEPAGFYSSLALWTDGTPNKMNEHRLMEKDTGQKEIKAREATFVSLLLPHQTLVEKGLPIPEFFIWGDDIEYTRRISKDIPGLLVKESKVLHKTANNAGSDISKDDLARLSRYFYAYRNEVFMARKEGAYRMARQLAKILYHSARVMLLSDHKGKRLSMIWKSSKEGLSFNPAVPEQADFEGLFLKLTGKRYNQ